MDVSIEQMFGELQSLLQTEAIEDRAWRARLHSLLEQGWRRDPHIYTERWLPLLQAQSQNWHEPLTTVDSLEQLKDHLRWLPGMLGLRWRSGQDSAAMEIEQLACAADLRQIIALKIVKQPLSDQGAIALASSPHLHNLRSLWLVKANISDLGLQALLHSDIVGNLRQLFLWGNPIGDAGALTLAQAPRLKNLRKLALDHHALSPEAVQALAESAVLGPDVRSTWSARLNKMQHYFGELRSLLQRGPRTDGSDHRALLGLVQKAHDDDPQTYQGQWLPYLRSHTSHWDSPVLTINEPQDASTWQPLLPLELVQWKLEGPALAQLPTQAPLAFGHLAISNYALPPEHIASLAEQGHLQHLRGLTLQATHLRPDTLRLLLALPSLARLRRLELSDQRLDTQCLQLLADCEHLQGLQHLTLAGCAIEDEGATILASAQFLPCLRALDLQRNTIEDAGLRALLGGGLHALESLLLAQNRIGDAGIRALAQASMPALQILDLQQNAIGDAGATSLTNQEMLGRLRRLDLRQNAIQDEGAGALLRHLEALSNLDAMRLEGNPVGSQMVKALADAGAPGQGFILGWRHSLQRMDVLLEQLQTHLSKPGHGLSVEQLERAHALHPGIYAEQWRPFLEQASQSWDAPVHTIYRLSQLAYYAELLPTASLEVVLERELPSWDNPQLETVRALSLTATDMDEAQCIAMANAEHLRHLRRLDLEGCSVGDAGFAALLTSQHLRKLQGLNLARNQLRGRLRQLTPSFALRELRLHHNAIDDEGLQQMLEWGILPRPLRFLSLAQNPLADASATSLAHHDGLSNLEQLFLQHTAIGDVGAQAIADATELQNLVQLDLWNDHIGAPGALAIAHSANLPRLRYLDLNPEMIGEEAMRALAGAEQFDEDLRLSWQYILESRQHG